MGILGDAKVFNDKIGMVATASGLILIPFFGVAAAGALAAGATNGALLGSFWAPLFTSSTGTVGVTAGIGPMFNGWAALAEAGVEVVSAGIDGYSYGDTFGAMGDALALAA